MISMASTAAATKIHTYHCTCTTLLLATPYALSTLPRRSSPALDSALILPLGPAPSASDDTPATSAAGASGEAKDRFAYSMVLSTSLDRKPVIVRREDGFEKRWVRRCVRCRVPVGYVLRLPSESAGEEREGEDVVYLFEEGLRATEEL